LRSDHFIDAHKTKIMRFFDLAPNEEKRE